MWRAGRNGRKTQSTIGGSGNFNKLRELTYKACFRLLQERWIPAPTQHILRVYIGGLNLLQSRIPCRCSHSTSLSPGYVLGVASGSREGWWKSHSKGSRGRTSKCSGPSQGSISGHVFLGPLCMFHVHYYNRSRLWTTCSTPTTHPPTPTPASPPQASENGKLKLCIS